MKLVLRLLTHAIAIAIGFAAGIYMLPILTAPEPPSQEVVQAAADNAQFNTEFVRDLPGSDFLHWGEGKVAIGTDQIALTGKIAPGPDYKLYLSPTFVDDEDKFNAEKSTMIRIGDVKTFENFVIDVPKGIDVSKFNAVIVWCEAFGEFITAAKYQ